jgi:hypothetical protein
MPEEGNFQRRAIVQKTNPETTEHQVRFQPERFNSLIYDKAYDAWIDRAFRCPCAVKGAGQALATCNNCLGTGWVFANRIETRIAVQGMKADVRYENWSRETTGMARISARAVDKLAFMDRIILREVEGYYNEILRVKPLLTDLVAYLEYPLILMEDIMLFISDTSPLVHLEEKIDYTVSGENKISFLNPSINQDSVLTARYRHYVTYHIIEMNRDIMKVRTKDCSSSDEDLKEMPINGIARKAHYLFDNNKYDEEKRLIDNSK